MRNIALGVALGAALGVGYLALPSQQPPSRAPEPEVAPYPEPAYRDVLGLAITTAWADGWGWDQLGERSQQEYIDLARDILTCEDCKGTL